MNGLQLVPILIVGFCAVWFGLDRLNRRWEEKRLRSGGDTSQLQRDRKLWASSEPIYDEWVGESAARIVPGSVRAKGRRRKP